VKFNRTSREEVLYGVMVKGNSTRQIESDKEDW
jgi:hypothetical protein